MTSNPNCMMIHFNHLLIEDHKRRTVPLARFRGIKFKDPSASQK